jgi:hypothetical protein
MGFAIYANPLFIFNHTMNSELDIGTDGDLKRSTTEKMVLFVNSNFITIFPKNFPHIKILIQTI